ncbi:MAG: phosphodiester glycosidase family protein [Synechococcaceae cyanobacterium]|nr:phosphodiester glycosidase family protein [Synechococcaceae cyanobacterium]
MVSWLVLAATLAGGVPASAQRDRPRLPSPPPALAAPSSAPPSVAGPRRAGRTLSISGRSRPAPWEWVGSAGRPPAQLWLTLEVLQEQLGFSSRTRPDGSLDLEWYGRGMIVPPARQRTLGDEVGVEVAQVLAAAGAAASLRGSALVIELPPPSLVQVRSASQPGVRRVVLDLSGPAAVESAGGELLLGLRGDPSLLGRLGALGLRGRQDPDGLRLAAEGGSPRKVFTLGSPHRVVIDLPAAATATATAAGSAAGAATIDPRLQSLLGGPLRWDRVVRQLGSRRIRINAVRVDPRTGPVELRPLSRPEGMEGLSSLPGLARRHDALVAINGGFFNRVRRLPLGALRNRGRWLSGPILNRGVVAWEPRSLPRFGRLRLDEWITDARGARWPVEFVNSGYVKRGLSRYTADWGPHYRALSGTETALLVRDGVVQHRFDQARLAAGVRLTAGDELIVARAGAPLPGQAGESLRLESRPSSDLGEASNVLGGGPLLLLDGRPVLDGRAEGFSPSFLQQGAPRTVIGSDGRFLWLVTLEGVDDAGPTLAEAALALREVGLRDALNLDGGSSTGLVMGGQHTVKGRGVAGSVHNALGLVPLPGGAGS